MWQYIQASSLTTSFVKLCLGSGWWPYYLMVTNINLNVPSMPWDWYCQHLRGLLGGFFCSCIWSLVQGRTSSLHSSRWISSFKVVFRPKSLQWRCSLLETSCAEMQLLTKNGLWEQDYFRNSKSYLKTPLHQPTEKCSKVQQHPCSEGL